MFPASLLLTAEKSPLMTEAPAAGWVKLPLGHDLLEASFSRQLQDLLIRSEDLTLVVKHYFSQPGLEGILAESGVKIAASGIETLVKAQTALQFAGPAEMPDSIGVVTKIAGNVTVERAGETLPLQQGDAVHLNDVVKTGNDGSIGITFEDKSVFTLGHDARMTLDSFVYDPETGDGGSNINVIKGMFKFVSGDIAANNPGEMKVETPVATIGIRGTTGGGSVEGEGGNNQFFLEPNADGTTGWFDVTTAQGTVSMNQPNMLVGVQSFNDAPNQPVVVPAAELQQNFGTVIEFTPPSQYDSRAATESRNDATQQPAATNTDANTTPQTPQQNAANAEMQTEQNQGEQTPGESSSGGDTALETFSGEASFDGQANGENALPEFIPTSVASENLQPSGAPQDFGVAAPSSSTISTGNTSSSGNEPVINPNMLLAPATESPLAPPQNTLEIAPGNTSISGDSTSNNFATATSTNTVATPPLTPSLPPVLIGQQQQDPAPLPPPPAPPPPAPEPEPAPSPSPSPTPGPTPEPTPIPDPGTGGGGGGAGVGGTQTVLFTVTPGNDTLTGNTANNIFEVISPSDLTVNDVLTGDIGRDVLRFAPSGGVYTLNFFAAGAGMFNIATSGIDAIEIQDSLGSASLGGAFFEQSDNQSIHIQNGAFNFNVSVANLKPTDRLIIEGTGIINLAGSGSALISNGVSNSSIQVNQTALLDVGYMLSGGSNILSKSGATDNMYIKQVGGSAHQFNLGGGRGAVELLGAVDGATISGGDLGRDIELKGTNNSINAVQVNASMGTQSGHYELSETADTTVNGGAGSDDFIITGDHTDLTLIDSTGAAFYLFNNVSGNVEASIAGGDNLHFGNAAGTASITLAHTNSTSAKLYAPQVDSLQLTSGTLQITLSSGYVLNFNNASTNQNYQLYLSDTAMPGEIFTGRVGPQLWNLASTDFDNNANFTTSYRSTGTPVAIFGASLSLSVWNDYVLTNSTAAQGIVALTGNDVIVRNTGNFNNVINGGDGFDVVKYSLLGTAITANFSGTVNFTGGTDTISNIEGIKGTAFNDVITGSFGNEWIEGGAGADNLTGGTGIDTLSYQSSSGGVNVNLDTLTLSDNDAAGDSIDVSFENVVGSAHSDIIIGDAFNNMLYGMDGNDSMLGSAGADTLEGGGGVDTLSGGSGFDAYILEIGKGNDVIQGFLTGGEDYLDISRITGGKNYFEFLLSGGSVSWIASGADTQIRVNGNTVGLLDSFSSSGLNFTHFHGGDGGYVLGSGGDTTKGDTIIAVAASTALSGNDGNDLLTANTLASVDMYGENGNDIMQFGNQTLASMGTVNGGDGEDILILQNITGATSLLTTDLAVKVSNVERIHLHGSGLTIGSALEIQSIAGGDGELYITRNVGGSETVSFQNSADWHLVTAMDNLPMQLPAGYSTYIANTSGADPVLVHVQTGMI